MEDGERDSFAAIELLPALAYGPRRFCVDQAVSERTFAPQCSPQNSAFNVCTAGVSSAPANWECFDTFGAFAVGPCAAQLDALNNCF